MQVVEMWLRLAVVVLYLFGDREGGNGEAEEAWASPIFLGFLV